MSVTTTHESRRGHAGHSHTHDNTYLTSTNKHDAGVRITMIGLWVNLGMAVGKGLGGYAFNSQALSADAVHSLTDLVSDFMTLATVAWALKPPTDRFPLGYGKFESLGSLGVSSLLLAGGALMGWSSVVELAHIYAPALHSTLEHLSLVHGHSHSHSIPNIQAAWLAGGSVLVKEWLYRATMKVAKEKRSAVLESNAVHHRVDSLTGIAALVSITASNVFPTLAGMDAFGGLLISWMVIRAGWSNTRKSLVELADAGLDSEIKHKVTSAALKDLDIESGNAIEVKAVGGTKAGQTYLLEIDLSVPGDWTAQKLRDIETTVRDSIGGKVRGTKRVRVRFIPINVNESDKMDEFISPSVSVRSTPEPEEHHHDHGSHDHDHSHSASGHDHTTSDSSATKRK